MCASVAFNSCLRPVPLLLSLLYPIEFIQRKNIKPSHDAVPMKYIVAKQVSILTFVNKDVRQQPSCADNSKFLLCVVNWN